MANSTPNQVFASFVAARKAYRQGVTENLSFPAYVDVVTPAVHNTQDIERFVSDSTPPGLRAVAQQALDHIAASARAVDLRKKTFLDYVRDAKATREHVDNYEDNRVKRHGAGRF